MVLVGQPTSAPEAIFKIKWFIPTYATSCYDLSSTWMVTDTADVSTPSSLYTASFNPNGPPYFLVSYNNPLVVGTY